MRIDTKPKPRREMDLIGLINAVFLLLVFFVVTGTIQHRGPDGVELAGTEEGDPRPAPANAPALDKDGNWILGAEIVSAERISAWLGGIAPESTVEIWVDARLEADRFQERLRAVDGLGGRTVQVITIRKRTP